MRALVGNIWLALLVRLLASHSITYAEDGIGMRKRILIGSFLGLATQWSGNGLTS